MGKWLINILTGSVADKLLEAYELKLNAKTDSDKLKANLLIARLEARQEVLIEEQKHWRTSWVRPGFALSFWIYLAKVIVWDKVLELGTTDPLSPELAEIMFVVLGAYYLARPFEKWLGRK